MLKSRLDVLVVALERGNENGLYLTAYITDHVLVTPLHNLDHFLLTLNRNMVPDTTHTPPIIIRCNLCSLSSSQAICYGFIFASFP